MAIYIDARGVIDLDPPGYADGLPLNADDLAAHVFDLLDARGQNPIKTPEAMDAARHAAAVLIGAFGVPADE